jgi:hypothetical protein
MVAFCAHGRKTGHRSTPTRCCVMPTTPPAARRGGRKSHSSSAALTKLILICSNATSRSGLRALKLLVLLHTSKKQSVTKLKRSLKCWFFGYPRPRPPISNYTFFLKAISNYTYTLLESYTRNGNNSDIKTNCKLFLETQYKRIYSYTYEYSPI